LKIDAGEIEIDRESANLLEHRLNEQPGLSMQGLEREEGRYCCFQGLIWCRWNGRLR
jgi:hypothetical protein